MRVQVTLELLKLGLIGCGRIAQAAHVPAVEKSAGIELVAVCDPTVSVAESIGRRLGVRHVTDVGALLDLDVDAVLIATPDRFHVDVAVQSLEAGKHVLVEKPVAMNVAEAEKLVPALAGSGLVFQVGSMKRHDPGVQFAGRVLAERRLGRILSATAWYRVMAGLRRPIEETLFPRLVTDPVVADRERSLKRAYAEDHLLRTHGIHTFDLIRHLLGDVRITSAAMAHHAEDHTWHGVARTERDGALLSFEVTASVHGEWSEGFDIFGEHGHLSIRLPFPFSRQPSRVSHFDEVSSRYERPVFGHTDPYRRQLESFAESVRIGSPGIPDLADGIAALELVDEVHRISKSSRSAGSEPAGPQHTSDAASSGRVEKNG